MTDGSWDRETARVVESFDTIAELYGTEFADKLHRKPADRELFDRLAEAVPAGRLVLEVGAGPGQVSAYLASKGVPVIVSDASLGQLRAARRLCPGLPLVAADLAHPPVWPGGIAGVVAYYCLMYGPPGHLDQVFAAWRRALCAGGLVAASFHAGVGSIRVMEWHGRKVDIVANLRQPDDVVRRLTAAGFTVDTCAVRPPYDDEVPTERCNVLARASLSQGISSARSNCLR